MDTRLPGPSEPATPLLRALTAVKALRGQLDELQRAQAEPIAVVGLGCRFPGGVQDAEGFWRLLAGRHDAITEVPPDRWDIDAFYAPDPEARGKIISRSGGFLDGIDLFAPELFGISPREAASLDPQQRLLLEVAWEALEEAGQAPDGLRGSRTGVFVGIAGNEYAHLLLAGGPERIDSYMGAGNAHSVAAGRLSFVFGFEGPSLAIDTACSSSLVAVHLACQSLRAGDCEMALAGGVNVLLTPTVSIAHSRSRMLAPNGRCKAFDANADGFVRSEGCGLVVLKRLSRALADADPVLALIRGSAVNQDGHTSGLTVPSGPAQEAVIRRALAQAGLAAADIGYVEAHGTGTALGDPIELQALAAVFGPQRPAARPLVVGSVKTNIGHAEAAAGIAGLIKAVLALRHGEIPPNLHFRRPNPRLDWAGMPIRVPVDPTPWPGAAGPRAMGVSSFGFGGTNAHVVLAEAPPPPPREAVATERPLHLLALSAQTPSALRALAARHEAHLAAQPGIDLADACHSANAGRARLRHRLCVVAGSAAEARAKLQALREGRDVAGLVTGTARAGRPPLVAFLFTGQGAQYAGMARVLFETQPAFRRDMEACDALLRAEMDRPLLDLLYAHGADGALDATVHTQPALFALEYALARLWMAWGVQPDLVMGHSLGEYVAACLAGVFTLEEGIRLVAARARLMQALPAGGGMAAVFAEEAELRAALAEVAPELDLAGVNGPRHMVVAGPRTGIERLLRHLAARGVEAQALNVSHAFHSGLIEPMLAPFERVTRGIAWAPPRLDIVSNVTGALAGPELAEPGYWVRHARQPVRFAEGMRTLGAQGVGVFLEIGPQPVLLGMGRRCLPDSDALWLSSLRRGQPDWAVMLDGLAALSVRGAPIDWRGFDAPWPRRRVALPTYPFERQRYWAAPEGAAAGPRPPRPSEADRHPLLGARQHQAHRPDDVLFEAELAAGECRLLDEHRVFGAAMMPASGYMEMAWAAAAARYCAVPAPVEDLVFHRPLMLPAKGGLIVQTSLRSDPGGLAFQVHSRPAEGEAAQPAWTLHASATLRPSSGVVAPPREDLVALRARIARPVQVEAFYQAYARHGVTFGPALRAVEALWQSQGEALGRLRLPEAASGERRWWMHPAWLDACAQVLGAAMPEAEGTSLQARICRAVVHAWPEGAAWAHARLRPGPAPIADLRLLDDAGQVLAELIGLEAAPVAAMPRPAAPASPTPKAYELRWLPRPRADAPLADPAAVVAGLRPRLEAALADPELLDYAAALGGLDVRAARHVAAAFRRLGWSFGTGQRVSTEAVARSLGILPHHARLLARLLEILAEDGQLRRYGAEWEVVATLAAGPDESAPANPAARDEGEMLDRCGARLAEVLTGRCDPLALIFPGGDHATAASLYQDSPGAAAMNALLREAVAGLVRRWPAGRPLRVLEVGAGTGSATAAVLPELPPGTGYTFTDISRGFLAEARRRFAGQPGLDFRTLDIEQPPEGQGFAGEAYDLVIAFNVLHATRSLRESLSHVRRLLAPGGLLLLLENVAPAAWIDVIWGLIPGWWRFADADLRPSYPLLDAEGWRAVLATTGFAAVECVAADAAAHPVLARQALVVAQAAGIGAPAGAPRGTWLILADTGGLGARLAARLAAAGQRAVLARRGEGFARLGEDEFALAPGEAGEARRLLAALAGEGAAPCTVLHLWGLDAPAAEGLTPAALMAESVALSASAIALTQALAEAAQPAALWLATRGAQQVGEGDRPALAQATLFGTGKTIARELPELWGGMLDLDPAGEADEVEAILAELRRPDGEDHIARRGGQRLVARLAACGDLSAPMPRLRADATYLVTGGLGALGLETARWLVDRGARHLALVGRSAASGAAAEAVAELGRRAHVRVFPADVADEAAMGRVLEAISAGDAPLRGVVHAAGLPGRCGIRALDSAALERIFAAKVAGSWVLHWLTRSAELDFFVCYSSMVSIWGAREQCHYAAANHFLDVFAAYRRAIGLPALCVNWGPLSGGGMLPTEQVADLRRIGVEATPMQGAPAMLDGLLGAGAAQAAVVRIDWRLFQVAYQSRGPCRIFDLVAFCDGVAAQAPPAAAEDDVLARLRAAPQGDRREILRAHLRATLGHVLGLDAGRSLDPQQGFFDLGLDSLTAMELRTALQASLGTALPATLAFDYGTLEALTDFLRDRLEPGTPAPAASARPTPDRSATTRGELAAMSEAEVEALLEAKLQAL